MEWILIITIVTAIAFFILISQKANSKEYLKPRQEPEINLETKQENINWKTLYKKLSAIKVEPQNKKNNDSNKFYNYRKNEYFFTRAESAFYRNLVKATEETHIVLSKVRIADLIEPAYTPYTKIYGSAFNKISRKHVDFVLINKNNLIIQAAIELDDSSHQRTDRQKSDRVKNEAFKNAGLALFRINKGTDFNPEKLKEILGIDRQLSNIK